MTPGTPGTAGNPDGAADGTSRDAATDATSADAASTGASSARGASAGGDAVAGDTSAGGDAVAGGAPSGSRDSASSAPGANGWKRPAPTLTTGTARPEGGGRAAPGDASAPARQWPLLTVLGLAGIGLLVVGTDAVPQSFRIGTMLVGAALLVGAVLRRVLPSVGMLAVRSRFTDMITYGVMGGLIVLLSLMVQPEPWLKIPFLEDVLHLTVT
ncbi:DUF3017 domain-containing protein [Streptomyces sp. NBC_01077]|uniref:DUF3017 domain-containing protein n=1 Tax=Streptomyces sp. NBC_01077 TaxID=2903746 RepID=UPI00386BF256|nr:DUF3017 domain-containing protein [Streptomyces sp. NBC_01077]